MAAIDRTRMERPIVADNDWSWQSKRFAIPRASRGLWLLAALIGLVSFVPATKALSAEAAPEASESIREKVFNAKRIVLLGDSITAAGTYAAYFDTWLVLQGSVEKPQILVAGLPSETTSGLSEEGHAGGQFPRPDLHERLDRVLKITQPDLVIACYGINCGIYQPFDAARFAKYQEGMKRLHAKVAEAGAALIVMTPPFYDDQRAGSKWSYNEVLDRYGEWLVSQRAEGWIVLDLHKKMNEAVAQRRAADPGFTFQPDAVHPNEQGHWYIASQLIGWCGDQQTMALNSPQEMLASHGRDAALLSLVEKRINVLRDAYVGAAGHKRPGIAPGLPIDEAEAQAKQLTARIAELLAAPRSP